VSEWKLRLSHRSKLRIPGLSLGKRSSLWLAGKSSPTLREYHPPALKADVAPNVKWTYAKHGFATLGQLVEDLSGQPFAEYMIDQIAKHLRRL
jgi:CubicO group peptidase (beta-lactamase class C family)